MNGGQAGTESLPDGPIEAPDADAYFNALAQLLCGGLDACCSEAGFEFAVDTCSSVLSSAATGLENVEYDRDAGEECLETLRAAAGDCDGSGAASMSLSFNQLCKGVFAGTIPLGDECDRNEECVPSELGDVECEPIGSGLDEFCIVEVRATEGDPCVETCFESTGSRWCGYAVSGMDEGNPERGQCFLNDGLRCDSSTGMCVATLARGDACNESLDCGAFAVCDGVCSDGAGDGEACVEDSECEEGLACDAGTCGTVSQWDEENCSAFNR